MPRSSAQPAFVSSSRSRPGNWECRIRAHVPLTCSLGRDLNDIAALQDTNVASRTRREFKLHDEIADRDSMFDEPPAGLSFVINPVANAPAHLISAFAQLACTRFRRHRFAAAAADHCQVASCRRRSRPAQHKEAAKLKEVSGSKGRWRRSWSEWQDLNLRPPRPERGALPDCATLRHWRRLYSPGFGPASAGGFRYLGPEIANRNPACEIVMPARMLDADHAI